LKPRKRTDPHEGMFWDGFQWIPKESVASLPTGIPLGAGFGRNLK